MGQMETTFSTTKYKRPKSTNTEEVPISQYHDREILYSSQLIAGVAIAENKIQLQKLQAHVVCIVKKMT